MQSSPLMTLLFNAGLPVSGYEFERHSLNEREVMLQQLFANTDAIVTRNPAVTLAAHTTVSTLVGSEIRDQSRYVIIVVYFS